MLDAVPWNIHSKVDLEEIMSLGVANQSSIDGVERSTLTASDVAEWRRRVVVSLANVFVRRGSWRLALGLLEAMGEEYASSARIGKYLGEDGTVPERAVIAGSATVAAIRVDVLTRIGRVFLQFGALEDAEVYFRRAEETATEPANDPRVRICPRYESNFKICLLCRVWFIRFGGIGEA